ncbi:MAG: hypothetical protein II777_10085 [Clostridia bacterium]|nr:hypothetical protein [Clostridia bacterium]
MKNTDIYKSLSYVDGKYVQEAENYKKPNKRVIVILAAAIVLTAVIVSTVIGVMLKNKSPEIPIPGTVTKTGPETAADSGTVTENRSAPSAAPGAYYGENIDGYASSGGASAELADDGLSALLKPVSVSKDLYKFYGNIKGEYYLALFEVKKVYRSTCTVGSFYVAVPKDYYADFTKYDEIVCYNLHQIALDHFVIYNVTENKAEMLMLPTFGNYYPYSSYVEFQASRYYAYNDGKLDMSLWDTNDKWKVWCDDRHREYALEHCASVKAAEKKFTPENDWHLQRRVNTLDGIEDEEAKRILSYVSDFNNGIFISRVSYNFMFGGSMDQTFTRYINGYPTDEVYSFYIYMYDRDGKDKKVENVRFADNVFTAEDIETLPDLDAVLSETYKQAQEGKIKPPHLQIGIKPTVMKRGVNGWYSKSGGKVYTVVRVGFAFQLEGDKSWQYRIDDQYYVYDSGKLTPVTRDELLELIPDCPYAYNGEYVENGRPLYEMPMY